MGIRERLKGLSSEERAKVLGMAANDIHFRRTHVPDCRIDEDRIAQVATRIATESFDRLPALVAWRGRMTTTKSSQAT